MCLSSLAANTELEGGGSLFLLQLLPSEAVSCKLSHSGKQCHCGAVGRGSSCGRAVLNRHHVFCLGSRVNRGVLAADTI